MKNLRTRTCRFSGRTSDWRSQNRSSAAMRMSFYIFSFVCAVGVSLAAGTALRKIQVSPANIQSMPVVVEYDANKGSGHFLVTANQVDRERNTLQSGSLWIYDGSNYVSDCPISPGPVIKGRVIFVFGVSSNYFNSSWFVLHYGTTTNWPASYWFYLKDFSHAR